MKHLWFGIVLLTLLLIIGLWLGESLDNCHAPAIKDLERASGAAEKADWPLADALYARAEKHWRRHKNLTAVVTHHNLIEQIDAGFAALENYSRCEETALFAATCSQLAQQLHGIPESHRFLWQNIL